MLTAKSFGILAGVILLFAFIGIGRPRAAMDIYLHNTYYVVGWRGPLLVMALLCGVIALICISFDKWASHPLNRTMGATSFGLIALSFIALLALLRLLPVTPERFHSLSVALFAATFAFFFGCALFAVNVICTLLRLLHAKLITR